MDIPEEDNLALAKRRAIQVLMQNKKLTPSERNLKMQEIMKGNFGVVEEIDSSNNNSSGKNNNDSSDDDSSFVSEADSYQGSTRTGRSSKSGRISTKRGSVNSSESRGSKTSKVDPRNDTSQHSTLSSTTHTMEEKEFKKVGQQKDRQQMLLAISRDKSLSQSQRQLKMKLIMRNSVEEEKDKGRVNRRASMSNRRPTLDGINESITIPGEEDADSTVQHQSRRKLKGGKMTELGLLIERVEKDDCSLTRVEMEKKKLSDEDVIPLFDALANNTRVTSISFRMNRIGNEGISALASALLDNTTLTLIDLSGNNIGDDGIEDLCKVLPFNKSLTQLNLADNKFGDIAASELAGALVDNASLVDINLNGNMVGDHGATDLFKVLATANGTVASLLLRLNSITDKGATSLASALIDNESLVSVDLGHNKITNQGAKDLIKVIPCNETIEELKLDGNPHIDQKLLDEVERTLNEDSEEESSESGSDYSEGSREEEQEGQMISSSYKMVDRDVQR